jgi:hypothetical protein
MPKKTKFEMHGDELRTGSFFKRHEFPSRKKAVKAAKRFSKHYNNCPVIVMKVTKKEIYAIS